MELEGKILTNSPLLFPCDYGIITKQRKTEMRPKAIDSELAEKIRTELADGTFSHKTAIDHYGIARATFYRTFGDVEVHTKEELALRDILREYEITIEGTSHRKMLTMDSLAYKFAPRLLAKVFGIAWDSYRKHRKNLTK